MGALQELEDREHLFIRAREAAEAELGEDELLVSVDLERSASTLHQVDLHRVLLLDRGSQTGRPGSVPSSCAVFDPELHACSITSSRPRCNRPTPRHPRGTTLPR